jgi:hypothetical protein
MTEEVVMIFKEKITRGRVEAVRTALIRVVEQEILMTQRFKDKPLGVRVTLDDAKLLLAIVDVTLKQFDAAEESLAEKLLKAALEKNNPRKHKK